MSFSDRFRDLEHLIAETMGDAVEGVRRSLAGEVRRRTNELVRESRRQTLGELHGSIRRLDRAAGQSELLAALLEEAARFASRAALLLTFEQGARGWGAYGFGEGTAAMADLELDYQGPWAELARGTGCVRLEADACAYLCDRLGAEAPAEGMLVPLVLRDRVAAALYADRVGDETPFEPAALQMLTLAAAQLVELQALRRRIATPTLYAADEGEEALPLWQQDEAAGEPPGGEPATPSEPTAAKAPESEPFEATGLEEPEIEAGEPLGDLGPELGAAAVSEGSRIPAEEVVPGWEAEDTGAGEKAEPGVTEGSGIAEAPEGVLPPGAAEEDSWPGMPAGAGAEEEDAEAFAGTVAPAFEQESELLAEEAETPDLEPLEEEGFESARGFALEPAPELEAAEEGEAGTEDDASELEPTASMPRAEPGGESTVRLSREVLERYAATEAEEVPEGEPEGEIEPSEDRTVLLHRSELTAPEAPPEPAAPPYREPASAPVGGPVGGSTEVTPPPDLEGPGWAFREQDARTAATPTRDPEQAVLHEEARRLARLLVSEIKLYNEEQVEEGRRNRDLYSRLQEDIDRSRQMYEERVDPRVRDETDYFQQEMVNILAGGDAGALGI